jgi:hypothetical protein
MPKMAPDMKAGMGMPQFASRAMRPGGMAKGGKVPMEKWEHSAKDLAQDKKLAKKHGMSMEAWEKSAADVKHDKQQSMKGLKKGGDIMAIKDTPMGRKMASAAMGAKKMARGGGVEVRGKTKGRFV